jgi:hypothetical protein
MLLTGGKHMHTPQERQYRMPQVVILFQFVVVARRYASIEEDLDR